MAVGTTVLVIHHPNDDILINTAHKHQALQSILHYLEGAQSGAKGMGGKLAITQNGGTHTASTGTVTCAAVTAADTVTINGVVFTAIAATATPTNNQWSIGTTNTEAATNLAAAINASTSAGIVGIVVATSAAAVVTVSSLLGILGDSVTLATSNGTRLAKSGTSLAGGATGTSMVLTF